MKETDFARQYMRSFERQTGAASFKIPDPRMAAGMGQITGTRFVDTVACCHGVFIALEWKLLRDRQGYRIQKVRESQLVALERVNAAGGVGLLMFGLYRGPKDKITYVVPPDRWRAVVANAKRLSIRVPEEFADCATTMFQHGSFRDWDITSILERVNDCKHRK